MNEWWKQRVPRPRPQPRQLPPLSPSMHGGVPPMADEPAMQDATFNPFGGNQATPSYQGVPALSAGETQSPQIETLGGLTSQAPPIAAPAESPQGYGTGLPMPTMPEATPEQAPPRMDQQELDYAQIMAPPKKTNKLLDALYVAAQGAANIFDTEGNYQPIERLGETKKRYKDAQAMQRIQVRNAKQKAEQEAAKRGWEITKEQAEAGKKVSEALQQLNPVLWESIKQKGFIDEADQQALLKAGYGLVQIGDFRKYLREWNAAGQQVATPETGKPNWQPTGLEDPKEGTSIYKGRPMKPSEAGRLESDDAQFNTREVNDITVKNAELFRGYLNDNYDRFRQYERDVNDVLSKQASLLATLNGGDSKQDADLNKELGDLQWAMQDVNDKYTKSKTAEEAETFKRQYETLYGQMESLQQKMANRIRQRASGDAQINQTLSQLRMPKRPKWAKFEPIRAATVPAASGRTTESAARNYLSSKGLKGKALEDAIRAGRAAGEIY